MPKKKTLKEVLLQFKNVHGDRYDYSRVIYAGSAKKVDVVCSKHGVFQIAPGHHANGVGCAQCSYDEARITYSDFINKATEINGDLYDYSRIPNPFPGSTTKLNIRCKKHDFWFEQKSGSHLKGHTGCTECKSEIYRGPLSSRGTRTSVEDATVNFVNRAKSVHHLRYDYSKSIYRSLNAEIEITCRDHGDFLQLPSNHLKGSGCPICASESLKKGTFKEKCAAAGVNYYRALKRREAGMAEEKILQDGYVRFERTTKTAVTVHGVYYPNMAEACRILEPVASKRTIQRWIKAGMPPEEAFSKVPNPGYANGIIYKITQVSTGKMYVGLTVMGIDKRWENHLQQAVDERIKSDKSLHNAIREAGSKDFLIEQIDMGQTKSDLEGKEIYWIEKLGTLHPAGFNLNKGGSSGGSNPTSTPVDGRTFDSRKAAVQYISKTRKISFHAAEARLRSGNIDIKTPAAAGQSLVKTKEYKAWSGMKASLSPRSKEHIPDIGIHEPWRNDFQHWLKEVGPAPSPKHRFCRHDKNLGFFPGNCSWMTPREDAEYRRASSRPLFGGVAPKRARNVKK